MSKPIYLTMLNAKTCFLLKRGYQIITQFKYTFNNAIHLKCLSLKL